MTIKDNIMLYVIRKSNEIETEGRQIQEQVRRQPMDNLDHYEVLLHKINLDAWQEFMQDLYRMILNLK